MRLLKGGTLGRILGPALDHHKDDLAPSNLPIACPVVDEVELHGMMSGVQKQVIIAILEAARKSRRISLLQ
jgi:hypothetical protein